MRAVSTTSLLLCLLAVGCSGEAQFNSTDGVSAQPTSTVSTKPDPLAGVRPGQPVVKDAGRVEQSFPATEMVVAKATAMKTAEGVETPVTLTGKYAATTRTFQQVTRPVVTQMARQGVRGTTHRQTFQQADRGVLDLVVVVDNSGSMAEEQNNLASKLVPLLGSIAQSDWRINVVTTDPANGCSRGVIAKNDGDKENLFRTAVTAGISGSGNEQGIRMAVEGLACATTTWRRAGATVGVLIVSDEDNCSSNGSGCGGQAWNTPDYLLNYLKNDLGRTLGTDARVYGLFRHPNQACSTAAAAATQYADAVQRSQGTWGSICDADYTATLTKISQDVATILKDQFVLDHAPDTGSVTVTVNGTARNAGFTLNGRTLTFTENTPPQGATIVVDYSAGRTAMFDRIALEGAAVPTSIDVSVDGTKLAGGEWRYDDATRAVIFGAAPAENVEVKVVYRRAAGLLTTFDLGAPARAGSVKVKVAGADAAATLSGQTIELAAAPADGAEIVVSFDMVTGKELSYPVVGAGAKEVTVIDQATRAAVKHTIEGNVLTIDGSEHQEGRVLLLQYRADVDGKLVFTLAAAPEPGTWRVDFGLCAGAAWTVEGMTVSGACDVEEGKEVALTYSYRTAPKKSFALEGVADAEAGVWSVTVDGAPVEFTRVATVVTLAVAPAPTAIVTVVYSPAAEGGPFVTASL